MRGIRVALAILSLGTGYAQSGEPGDLVEINARIVKTGAEGTSQVLSEPTLILALDKWGEVEDLRSICVPKDWTVLSIPQEISGSVTVDDPGDPTAQFETNPKKLVVPPQPQRLEERQYGWKVAFRPRLHSSGRVIVDCRLIHTMFPGYLSVGNPVRWKKKGVLGGGGKEILIDPNSRVKGEFATREQRIAFLPTESGHAPTIESETVSPEEFDFSRAAGLEVQLSAKRLEKREAKRSKLRNPVVYLTTRFFEVSGEAGVADDLSEWKTPRILTDPEFQVLVRALSQQKGVDLLTAPSIVTPSGTEANIEVVREFVYPSRYSAATINSAEKTGNNGFAASPAAPIEFETKEPGVAATLTPRTLSDGRIELTFEPQATEFLEFTNFGNPIKLIDLNQPAERNRIVVTENRIVSPSFTNRRIKTTVRLNNGETLFFGGITREDIQDVEDKVAILGDLPVVGRLARKEVELRIRRNLFFAVKVELMEKE